MPPWPAPRRSAILCLRLLVYWGSSFASVVSWPVTAHPMPPRKHKRQHHDQDHRRRASEPKALKRADDRIQQEGQQEASATGISTTRPQDRHAMTRTKLARA